MCNKYKNGRRFYPRYVIIEDLVKTRFVTEDLVTNIYYLLHWKICDNRRSKLQVVYIMVLIYKGRFYG